MARKDHRNAGSVTSGTQSSRRTPRYVPDQPLPPYAFVSGRFPHPTRDPRGHSFCVERKRSGPLEPVLWESSRPYMYAVDLFNHGYYWEAHESWEGLWRDFDRSGPTGCFLGGLIKLAAAGVKLRQGKARGARRHARRAAGLFEQTARAVGGADVRYMGLLLGDLITFAGRVASEPKIPARTAEGVFDFLLRPARRARARHADRRRG